VVPRSLSDAEKDALILSLQAIIVELRATIAQLEANLAANSFSFWVRARRGIYVRQPEFYERRRAIG
jgi:hypothetical protein